MWFKEQFYQLQVEYDIQYFKVVGIYFDITI